MRGWAALGAAIAAVGVGLALQYARSSWRAAHDGEALVTPEGVTLQPLGKAQGYDLGKSTASAIARDQIAYADTKGMTLYTWDEEPLGKAACLDSCAESFKPFLAQDQSKSLGEWSLIDRSDGS